MYVLATITTVILALALVAGHNVWRALAARPGEDDALWTRAAEEGDARAIGFHGGLDSVEGQRDHAR